MAEAMLCDEVRPHLTVYNNMDKKLQSEIINEKNKKKKQIEILNRLKSYLNTLDENKVYSKEEINLGFVKKLNK